MRWHAAALGAPSAINPAWRVELERQFGAGP
jgi:hypothetical protein